MESEISLYFRGFEEGGIMTDFSIIIQHIFQTYHQGKENAVTRQEFFRRYGYLLEEINDREFRQIYSNLPICTCSAGGFWPVKKEEVMEFQDHIEKVRDSLKQRRIMVIRQHAHLFRDKEYPDQQRLF
jgi:hypothetical protein